MPVATTAAILGGGALLGGILGSNAASDAADAQANQARRALEFAKQQDARTYGDLSSYRNAGTTALGTYRDALGLGGADAANAAWGKYTQSPELAGLLKNVQNQVQGSNAARGNLFSGATAQGIGDRSTQLYLGDANNWLSGLRDLYGSGQNAATAGGQIGQQTASQVGQQYNNIGNAQAGGAINSANSYSNALSNLGGIYGAQQGGAFSNAGGGNKSPQWGGFGFN